MFYVSSINSKDTYYITDTEDGVTELCTTKQIWELIQAGYEIEGISWEKRNFRGRQRVYISAHVVAGKDNKSFVAKMLVAHGIDVAIAPDGGLSKFFFKTRANEDTAHHEIRFSKFCNGLHNMSLMLNRYDLLRDVRFIFDDNLEYIEKGAFKGVNFSTYSVSVIQPNMVFDIGELTDKGMREYLLERLVKDGCMQIVYDSDESKTDVLYYQLMEFLNCGNTLQHTFYDTLRIPRERLVKLPCFREDILAMYFKKNWRATKNSLETYMYGAPSCKKDINWFTDNTNIRNVREQKLREVDNKMMDVADYISFHDSDSAREILKENYTFAFNLPFMAGNGYLKAAMFLYVFDLLPESHNELFELFLGCYSNLVTDFIQQKVNTGYVKLGRQF